EECSLTADNLRSGIHYEGVKSDVCFENLSFSKAFQIVLAQAFKILSRFRLDGGIDCNIFLLAILDTLESGRLRTIQGDGEAVAEIFNSLEGDKTVSKMRIELIDYLKDRRSDSESNEDKDKSEESGKSDKPKKSGAAKTPELDKVCRDLTKLAADGKLDPLIGRQDELDRLIMVLSKRKKCNPVLVGEAGVGKTIIVEGLAQRIARGEVPDRLKGCRVCALSMAGVVGGTKYRGMFEERMTKIVKELTNTKSKVIIFVDEIHTLVAAGDSEGGLDAANILKPALARGEFQCIGATTVDEYTKYIEKDKALERRFQPIRVEAPNEDEACRILFGLRGGYEKHHGVDISDEAIREAVRLSNRYISDRLLPDKAIDVMDEACSRVSLNRGRMPKDILEKKRAVRDLNRQANEAFSAQEYEKGQKLKDEAAALEKTLNRLRREWRERSGSGEAAERPCVGVEDVAYVVSMMSGVPVERVGQEESKRLVHIEEILHKRIVGQDEPIKVISRAIKRARGGFKDPHKPIGSFLLLGPTGVGKTELARTLAEFLFGDENALIRLDMSEFSEKFSVSRMYGAAPGYVGYEEGGELTDAVRRKPYSVVLFDEIEKAHPDIFNVLLQILDEGRLTDSKRHVVDFKNTVIMMTSNIGFDHPDRSEGMGLRGKRSEGTPEERFKSMERRVLEDVKQSFKPEFLNRLDGSVVFHSLETEHLIKIVDIMLGKVSQNLAISKRRIEVSEDAKKALVYSSCDPQYGARPLRRAIQEMIEDPLSDYVLEGSFPEGSAMSVDLNYDGKLKLAAYEAAGKANRGKDDEIDFELAFDLLK
ncbi:ATP-dependent Clp protease ATP-binding subunit, partial [bacterium]|nr:ATP-dependent Clp protease ATP-binding subunit [bacterium]